MTTKPLFIHAHAEGYFSLLEALVRTGALNLLHVNVKTEVRYFLANRANLNVRNVWEIFAYLNFHTRTGSPPVRALFNLYDVFTPPPVETLGVGQYIWEKDPNHDPRNLPWRQGGKQPRVRICVSFDVESTNPTVAYRLLSNALEELVDGNDDLQWESTNEWYDAFGERIPLEDVHSITANK